MRRFGVPLLIMVAVVAALRVWVVSPYTVASASMQPTLCTGDVVIMHKIGPRTPLARQDVVGFLRPSGTTDGVKRVVALPGDSVAIADGVLVVNDEQIEEGFVDQRTIDGVYFGPVTVPTGSVFVMGDNRELSIDSRAFGPLERADVHERLLLRLPFGCRS